VTARLQAIPAWCHAGGLPLGFLLCLNGSGVEGGQLVECGVDVLVDPVGLDVLCTAAGYPPERAKAERFGET
jgi:hypothetical protein